MARLTGRIALVCIVALMGLGFLNADPLTVRRGVPEHGEAVFVELVVDSNRVVVGQPVAYELRVLYDPHRIEVRSVSRPEVDKPVVVEAGKDGVQGTEKRDGAIWSKLSWSGVFYPKEAGSLTLAPTQLDYVVRGERQSRGSWGFFSMFGEPEKIHSITSEAQKIKVDALPPLPASAEECSGVGVYTDCQVSVDRQKVMQGDAVQVRYTLEGEGSAGLLSSPQLKVPDYCSAYFSECKRQKGRVTLGYVIQAHQAGNVEIPGQRFLFFDPQDKSYYSVKSPSFTLVVESRPEGEKLPSDPSNSEQDEQFADQDEQDEKPKAVALQFHSTPVRRLEIPVGYFVGLLAMVLAGRLTVLLWPWGVCTMKRLLAQRRRKKKARQLRLVIENGDRVDLIEQLYKFFLPCAGLITGAEWERFWIELQGLYFTHEKNVLEDPSFWPSFKMRCERWLWHSEKMK
ncbi:TPA: hypothetical protein DDZ86_05225 [Candidatus Dependentiae bacterium]|nr:hypothetical protein [Candidatus Dependentiae bacterium]